VCDNVFVKEGYHNWKQLGEKLSKHADTSAHKTSMVVWMAYNQTKLCGSVADQQVSQRAVTIASNRKYITILSKVAVLCACQGIPLRGHDESANSHNKGNFVEVLELLLSVVPELKSQMNILAKNARYTSHIIQDDLLKAAADVVWKEITDEIRKAEGFSVIADETRDISKIEQMSICLRYVSTQFRVYERFVGFIALSDLHARALAEAIVNKLNSVGLDVKKCIAQHYDSASVISGTVSGVQKRLSVILGTGCLHVRCYAHRYVICMYYHYSSYH
jgi:hypothetical protein